MAQTPKKGEYEDCLGEGRWLAFQDGEALLFAYFLPETGMHFTRQPIGHDKAASPMQAPHWPQLSLSVLANFFRNSTITSWRTMVIPIMAKNSLFLSIPLNIFFFSNFLALNSLKTWQRTKVLKMRVFLTFSFTPNMNFPLNCKTNKVVTWYMACAMRFFHIVLVISGSDRPTDGFDIRSLVGFSVANAKAPNVSIIRFTHKDRKSVV